MLLQRKLEEEAKVAQREAMRKLYEEEKIMVRCSHFDLLFLNHNHNSLYSISMPLGNVRKVQIERKV